MNQESIKINKTDIPDDVKAGRYKRMKKSDQFKPMMEGDM